MKNFTFLLSFLISGIVYAQPWGNTVTTDSENSLGLQIPISSLAGSLGFPTAQNWPSPFANKALYIYGYSDLDGPTSGWDPPTIRFHSHTKSTENGVSYNHSGVDIVGGVEFRGVTDVYDPNSTYSTMFRIGSTSFFYGPLEVEGHSFQEFNGLHIRPQGSHLNSMRLDVNSGIQLGSDIQGMFQNQNIFINGFGNVKKDLTVDENLSVQENITMDPIGASVFSWSGRQAPLTVHANPTDGKMYWARSGWDYDYSNYGSPTIFSEGAFRYALGYLTGPNKEILYRRTGDPLVIPIQSSDHLFLHTPVIESSSGARTRFDENVEITADEHDNSPSFSNGINDKGNIIFQNRKLVGQNVQIIKGMEISNLGDVLIGDGLNYGQLTPVTTLNDFNLFVGGGILTERIKVRVQNDWNQPDYVFEEDYDLMPLSEIESYVKKEKHLPGIPNKHEVKENGIDLAEMNRVLLEKVEELFLHTIQLEKEIVALKNK